MPPRAGWDYAQLRTSFASDPEFIRLSRAAPDDLHFLAAVGLWTIALAQAWKEDDPDVADVLGAFDAPAVAALLERDLVNGGGVLRGFDKWTAEARIGREHSRRRSAMNANERLTAAIRDRDGDTCRYCGKTVNWRDRRSADGGTYDHVIPLSAGGGESLDNLVVACRSCNAAKAARAPKEAGMVLLDLSGPRRSNPVLSGPRQEGEGEGELDIDTASTKRVPSPRQRVLAWLRTKGAAAPSGWANGSLNEMLGVYGADAVIGCWEGASPEVKTSRQFVQLAERELSPALFSKPKSTAKGFGPSAEEARNAFRR